MITTQRGLLALATVDAIKEVKLLVADFGWDVGLLNRSEHGLGCSRKVGVIPGNQWNY